jgi:hypothetical protein
MILLSTVSSRLAKSAYCIGSATCQCLWHSVLLDVKILYATLDVVAGMMKSYSCLSWTDILDASILLGKISAGHK